ECRACCATRRSLKPHLVHTFKLSNDPKFAEKVVDVVGLYMTPPERALVLCVDEKSQIQALGRTQPGLPIKKGRAQSLSGNIRLVRKHQAGLQSFRSMRRIEARRRKARPLRLRFSQSFASLRHRLSQAIVRSTIQRRGNTTNPLTLSERLTISISSCGRIFAKAFWNTGP